MKKSLMILTAIMALAASPDSKPFWRIDLFVGGEAGYHTFRIPALAVTNNGTILAFCEGRRLSPADHGFINLLLRRSTDHGKTWGPIQVLATDGWHTMGNPAPVVDRETGVVFLAFTRDNDRVFITSSDDDGATWSPPREITAEVKLPSWGWYATGPGHGIQLSSGRLLIPCDHRENGIMHSHVIYSDDHGQTWSRGGTLDPGTDECMAAEFSDGSLYLTMRNYTKQRAVARSSDQGLTWTPAEFDPGLTCPICQASVITDVDENGREMLLFLNPASATRDHMTLKISYDHGQTWPLERLIDPGKSAYSDLARLDDNAIGILYENGTRRYWDKITFARLERQWLSAEQPTP